MGKGKRLIGLVVGLLLMSPIWADSPREEVDPRILAAEADLRLGQAAAQRIADDVARERVRGILTPNELAEYEAYLAELRTLLQLQAERLARLRAVDSPKTLITPEPDLGAAPPQTDAEQVASLEQELGESLSDFDEMLLKEQDKLAQRQVTRRAAASGGGENGQGAEGGQSEGGESAGEGQSGFPDTSTDGAESEVDGDAPNGGNSEDPEQVAGNSRGAGAGGRHGRSVEERVGSGQDDDIVARQLREAAENETDPELREKLWEEYIRYKSRQRSNQESSQ